MSETKTVWNMTLDEQQKWLDDGGILVLPFGQSKYVARKLDDGAYVVYHFDYATFGQLVQYSAAYGPQWTLNPPGEPGAGLYEHSYEEIKKQLDDGKVFSLPLSNHESFCMRRMPDGAYHQYSPERDTFPSLQQRLAQYGPAWLWEAKQDG